MPNFRDDAFSKQADLLIFLNRHLNESYLINGKKQTC